MADRLSSRLAALAADHNIDAEDVQLILDAAMEDNVLSAAEVAALRAALTAKGAEFEPAAKRYLEAALAGKATPLPNRVLLAPHPRGGQRELFYSRYDVVKLQEALNTLGVRAAVDGDFGPSTTEAVRTLQSRLNLAPSGLLDSVTLGALNKALEAKGAQLLDLNPRAHIRPDRVVALRHGTNREQIVALQQGITRLGRHFNMPVFQLVESGVFDEHMEQVVKSFQARAFLPETGIVDDSTVAALNAALSAVGLPAVAVTPPEGGAGFKGDVELHFYPGDAEQKVYVLQRGKLLDVYGMVGGNLVGRDDPNNPHIDFSPSPKGSYDVVEVNPHTSMAWQWSYVPYGSPLREQGGQVQYQDAAGVWRYATGPSGAFVGRKPAPLERASYLDKEGKLLPFWNLNDFGHLRGRLKSVATGTLQGHMIHPSAFNEGTSAYFTDTDRLRDPAVALSVLHHSHGCEHIHPKDMDEIVARGYLAPGTRFVVHGYDERYSGPALA